LASLNIITIMNFNSRARAQALNAAGHTVASPDSPKELEMTKQQIIEKLEELKEMILSKDLELTDYARETAYCDIADAIVHLICGRS